MNGLKVTPLQQWSGAMLTFGILLTLCLTGHVLVLAIWLIIEIGFKVWALPRILAGRRAGRP